MNYCATIFALMISAFLVLSFFSQAYAADLKAFLIPQANSAAASYVGVKTVTLKYPAGGTLAKEFDGKNERFDFDLNATSSDQNETGMVNVLNAINKAFIEAQSPVQVQKSELSYSAVLKGGPESTLISYKVELRPTLAKYLITSSSSGDIVDLEWRGIVVKGPVVVNAPKIGKIDVNSPIGLLQATHPAVASKLDNGAAKDVLQDPILNFQSFNAPMDSWHRLFDPVGSYGGSVGLQDTGGAKALSVYSLGESSLREGTYTETEKTGSATVDGSQVDVKSTTAAPSGQITIAGYADHKGNQGSEFAVVTTEAPAGLQTSTGGFPIQVLLVFGGMMGAVAIFVLFKTRK